MKWKISRGTKQIGSVSKFPTVHVLFRWGRNGMEIFSCPKPKFWEVYKGAKLCFVLFFYFGCPLAFRLVVGKKLLITVNQPTICSQFQFELLCCVQDDQDPAINLVNQLRERYPKVDCRLFIGKLWPNPAVSWRDLRVAGTEERALNPAEKGAILTVGEINSSIFVVSEEVTTWRPMTVFVMFFLSHDKLESERLPFPAKEEFSMMTSAEMWNGWVLSVNFARHALVLCEGFGRQAKIKLVQS